MIDEEYTIVFKHKTPVAPRAATSGVASFLAGRTLSKVKGEIKLAYKLLDQRNYLVDKLLGQQRGKYKIIFDLKDKLKVAEDKIKELEKLKMPKVETGALTRKQTKISAPYQTPSQRYESKRYNSDTQGPMEPVQPLGIKGSALEPKPGTSKYTAATAKTGESLSVTDRQAPTKPMTKSSQPDVETVETQLDEAAKKRLKESRDKFSEDMLQRAKIESLKKRIEAQKKKTFN